MRREHIKTGTRVRLPENKAEGWKEEYGKVLADNDRKDILLIEVDRQYRDKGDDGLREVELRLVEILK